MSGLIPETAVLGARSVRRDHLAPGSTDANGWYVGATGDGKRQWRKRFTIADADLPAAVAANIIVGAALPVGVATLGDVRAAGCHLIGVDSAYLIRVNVAGLPGATTLAVVAHTSDGVTTIAATTTNAVQIDVTLVEA